jgi:hypothetical protein
MKKIQSIRNLVILCFIAFGFTNASAQTREIKEGEPIYLEIIKDENIDQIEIGNQIQFKVTSNVIVDGKEVIRAQSPAIGTVLRVEKSGYNTNGKIQIEVRHVRAVDGQQVLVFGPINLNNLNIHTPTTVYVKNQIKIDTSR